ncbi:MAG: IS66 family insertion sequence element accessory protein TnpB [Verrucomicrobiae bacterium]|nr:IS66 family insertion sequence element accessory protein TnpB [Verrucomicrobiae bacterium]
MLQITPQMRLLVAVEPVDFRKGIDGLAALCRSALGSDPLSGALFDNLSSQVRCLHDQAARPLQCPRPVPKILTPSPAALQSPPPYGIPAPTGHNLAFPSRPASNPSNCFGQNIWGWDSNCAGRNFRIAP